MKFVLRMAGREMRASWRRLLFFFVCISVGVGSMVALGSVIQSVREALMKESKSITAADLLIWADRPYSDNAKYVIDEKLEKHGALESTRSIESTAMARPDDQDGQLATMVELRAVERAFPLYGSMELAGGLAYDHRLLQNRGALVRPELLTRLGVEVGDRIRIGEAGFEIRGVVVREAGRSLTMFTLGPRVFIDYDDLEATGILEYGSRVRRQILVRIDEEEKLQGLVWDLEGGLANEFVRVRSYRDAGDQLARRLSRGESYLSLAGFVILILGGVGVWSVVRVFVAQKLKGIAVLKCLGASTRQVLSIYVCQVLLLSVAGCLLGLVIARLAVFWIPTAVGLDIREVEYGLTASAVAQGVGIGLLVSTLFSLIPLLHLRLVRPLWLLRPEGQGQAEPHTLAERLASLDRLQLAAGALLVIALVGVASWQAESLRIGGYVSATFVGVCLALHLAGVGLVRAVAPLSHRAYFPLRHAVLNVSRPGNQTRVILLAVGVGCCFVLTVRSIQQNLLEQFAVELRDDAPDLFFIDIQPDQVKMLEKRAKRLGASTVKLVPVLRARVVRVEGENVHLGSYEEVREQGSLGREYTITYRNHLEDNERIRSGELW
ncbi:MAG: ABC transporter permease, partial [Vicinamibacteria bacterium]